MFKTIMLLIGLHSTYGIVADPFAHIQYSKAFDQTDLYEQYRLLMEKLGCAENVFQAQGDVDSITHKETDEVELSFPELKARVQARAASFNPVADAKELENFQEACLNRLNNARRLTLGMPTLSALHDIAFKGLLTAVIMRYVQDSFSTGVTGMNFAYTAGYGLLDSVKSGYNLMFWPDNSLESLENHFAKNKCFIPRALWPKITKYFMAAREDQRSRDHYTNFIDFTLGFTVYKPKPLMIFKNGMSIDAVKKELNKRIDNFFADYIDKVNTHYIKINVAKFVDLLVHNNGSDIGQTPRYLYLYGPGGIGKTHFVQTLSGWIEELMPHSVQFEDIIINSLTDLEGSYSEPGAFLKVLRNQLLHNKRGSVLMIDEATWLNNPGMVGAAKRIFNGDRSKLTTSYFGSNIDGTGINLEIPPMLIFVASNDPIEDPALASRFDTIIYPRPSDQALAAHAMNIAKKSKALKDVDYAIDKDMMLKAIQNLDPKNRNFRYVAGNVEAQILANT